MTKAIAFPRPIVASDEFYRAIHPDYLDGARISSGAFSKSSGTNRMSVDWADKSTADETFERWQHWGDGRGVAAITAGLCWDNQQQIEFTPKVKNPSHSDVFDADDASISKTRLKKRMAQGAKLIIGASSKSSNP